MSATHSKIAGTGATKDWESCGMPKNTCLEHFTGEPVNWQQMSAMIGYKRSILERLNSLQARMGLCTTVWANSLKFKNNVSKCTNARNWGISSSTVHNITKRFRESGEISACKQQGQKPVTFDPSGGTALKTDIILSRILPHGLRNTSENHCQLTQFVATFTSAS